MIFIASFSHPWRNLQQMMVRSKSESKFMGSLYQIDLNKSSVSQYCILPRLILVARSSIAFYFVNISLVPVHSALSIQPGQAQCGLWFQFVTLLWGLQPPWSWPVTMKWGSEANSIKLVRVSWDAGGPVSLSVTEASPQPHQLCQCQHYHLSLFYPDPSFLNYSASPVLSPVELCSDQTPTLSLSFSLFEPSEPYSVLAASELN